MQVRKNFKAASTLLAQQFKLWQRLKRTEFKMLLGDCKELGDAVSQLFAVHEGFTPKL
jgi:hypothetical protein